MTMWANKSVETNPRQPGPLGATEKFQCGGAYAPPSLSAAVAHLNRWGHYAYPPLVTI